MQVSRGLATQASKPPAQKEIKVTSSQPFDRIIAVCSRGAADPRGCSSAPRDFHLCSLSTADYYDDDLVNLLSRYRNHAAVPGSLPALTIFHFGFRMSLWPKCSDFQKPLQMLNHVIFY
jgi:hypothetical protein